ncbi:MAG: DUF3488 and DUF4129 domain-containing transglutaminase family protein [Planctomycetes bacterium]|nr:DUF3488 and DUF4129 domain-containing transglutaminase family protein [Planctomycetota bacterium]
MTDRLFPFLLLLTLLDLAFVQATEVVPTVDLLPLWLLGAAAPWLRRLQRHLLYRMAWNGGVLLVFALLVRHATTTGLLHMLEDGLVLAVLCQVHLLNNVGEKQRPDLIFFNSFLIAFVTSFFAPDLWWSLLFVLHALALVPSLEVYGLVRAGRDLDPSLVRTLVRDSLPRTLLIGVATLVVFVAWPRDFRREGWLGEALALRDQYEAGIADRIRIGDEQATRLGEELVARITAVDSGASVPTHWRAIVFSTFDGTTWHPQEGARFVDRLVSDPPWQHMPDGSWQRGRSTGSEQNQAATPRWQVRLHALESGRLPLPLHAVRIRPERSQGTLLEARGFGGFSLLRAEDAPSGPLHYEVGVGGPRQPTAVPARTRAHFVALPDRGVPGTAFSLARQLRAELPANADPVLVAQTFADWLRTSRRYALPGEPGFARNLGEFLLGTGAGHCEYFATALALMLRTQDVPCRLAGGWLVHEVDPASGASIVRSKHAHAWVEVLAEDDSWHTFDATPASAVVDATRNDESWWSEIRADLDRWWAAITGFDQAARRRWLLALCELPARHPLALAGVLVAMLAMVYARRRRRQSEPSIARLLRSLRAARLRLLPGETPRELLQRAEAATIAAPLIAQLRAAAEQHEAQRYGNPSARNP